MININTQLLDKTSPDGLYLLCRITAYMNANRFCFPSNKTLAKATGFSESKVMRVKNELKDGGLLSSEFRFRDDKSQTSSIYRLETDLIGVFVTGGKMSELTPPPVMDDTPPVPISDTPPLSELTTREVLEDLSINQQESFIESQKEILAIVHDQVDETAVKVVEVIPSKAKKSPKYIYPPTIEELVQPIYEKLIEKKRIHTNIVDCWNNANMQAEKFHIHWEEKGWKIEKLNLAIAKWINNSISYGQVTKPCPIQYPNNPANAQPVQPTKVHVEEPKSPEQSKEARKAMFAAAKAELNQIGV